MGWWSVWVWLVACGDDRAGGEDPADTAGGRGGACGDVTEHDLRLRGRVLQDGAPVQGADVRLEERAWHPGSKVFGAAVTDAGGAFVFDAPGVVSVEDCWGTVLDYVLVAVRGDARVEDPVNSSLFGAITDGVDTVDLTNFPLEL